MTHAPAITVRQAAVSEIIDLRWAILLPAHPREMARFPGDHDPDTLHAAAFQGDTPVGCATLLRSTWQDQPAWRLRGMGVVEALRGRGVGRLLLEQLERLARAQSPIRLWWCDAREVAVQFYERLGWTIASDQFTIPTVGPHFKMTRQLTD